MDKGSNSILFLHEIVYSKLWFHVSTHCEVIDMNWLSHLFFCPLHCIFCILAQ